MMTTTKVFGIFFSLFFLFSCVEKKKIDKDLEIEKIHIYEHRSITNYELSEIETDGYTDIVKIKDDSTVIYIDLLKDSLFILKYAVNNRYDISGEYKLNEIKKWKNSTVYKPSIFNHIPLEYIQKNKVYNFLGREIEDDDYGVEFYFKDGSRTYWYFYMNLLTSYGKNYEEEKKRSEYPELFPFFAILKELGSCATFIYLDFDKNSKKNMR